MLKQHYLLCYFMSQFASCRPDAGPSLSEQVWCSVSYQPPLK